MKQSERNYILKWAKKIKSIRLLGGKCIDCGNDDIYTLDFHHKNPNEKEFQISLVGIHRRWSTIEKEVKKCVLLCRNCHIKRHFAQSETSRKKIRKQIFEYKNSFQCEECKYIDNTGLSLDLHHNEDKFFGISKELGRAVGFHTKREFNLTDRLINEIDKCSILCRNCHVKRHIDFDQQIQFKSLIEDKILNMEDRRRLTADDIERIHELRRQGLSAKKIVKELGYNLGQVEYHIYKKC